MSTNTPISPILPHDTIRTFLEKNHLSLTAKKLSFDELFQWPYPEIDMATLSPFHLPPLAKSDKPLLSLSSNTRIIAKIFLDLVREGDLNRIQAVLNSRELRVELATKVSRKIDLDALDREVRNELALGQEIAVHETLDELDHIDPKTLSQEALDVFIQKKHNLIQTALEILGSIRTEELDRKERDQLAQTTGQLLQKLDDLIRIRLDELVQTKLNNLVGKEIDVLIQSALFIAIEKENDFKDIAIWLIETTIKSLRDKRKKDVFFKAVEYGAVNVVKELLLQYSADLSSEIKGDGLYFAACWNRENIARILIELKQPVCFLDVEKMSLVTTKAREFSWDSDLVDWIRSLKVSDVV